MEELTQVTAILLPTIYFVRTGAFSNAVKAFRGELAISVPGSSSSSKKSSPGILGPILSPFTNIWNGLKALGLSSTTTGSQSANSGITVA